MKKRYFKLEKYIFYNDINLLIEYFNKEEIEYKKSNDKIEFYIKLEDKWIEANAYLYKDRISHIDFYAKCLDETESESLKKHITYKYSRDYREDKDYLYYTKIFTKKDKFIVKMILSNNLDFSLKVSFEDENHKLYQDKAYIRDVQSTVCIIVSAVLGLVLSILFMYLYFKHYDKNISIITGVMSYIHMAVSILLLCNIYDVEFKKKVLWPICLPILYVIILFVVLIIICNERPEYFMNLFIISVYTMPAFLIVVAITLLILVALSYA